MFGLGLPELIIILLLLFGAARLPKLARSLGQSAGELKKGYENGMDDKKDKNNHDTSSQNSQQS